VLAVVCGFALVVVAKLQAREMFGLGWHIALERDGPHKHQADHEREPREHQQHDKAAHQQHEHFKEHYKQDRSKHNHNTTAKRAKQLKHGQNRRQQDKPKPKPDRAGKGLVVWSEISRRFSHHSL
jgi:hypothetical protein